MDFGRGFNYVRQDPNWLVKTLLGSVISMVPILNFAALGYSMDVLRNVYNGQETPLPEWGENFGDRWVRGLLATIVQVVYMLPVILLYCVGIGLAGGLGAALSGTGADGDAAGAGVGALVLCLVPVVILAALFLAVLGMIGQARYAISNDFGTAMRFGEVLAEFRRNAGRWLMLILMLFVLALGLGLGMAVTCGLGVLLSFYFYLVQSHWLAQAYRESAGEIQPSMGGM